MCKYFPSAEMTGTEKENMDPPNRGELLPVPSIGVGTGGAAGAVAPATIKLGGGGDVFSPPQLFATKLNSNFEVM